MKMDVVVLAGGQMEPTEPLYDQGVEGYRSLIDIHGKPMVQWVIDALAGSSAIDTLIVIGLPDSHNLQADKPIKFLPDSGGMFENIKAGVLESSKIHPDRTKVMISSGDIPALRTEIVDWIVERVNESPKNWIYYNVVSKTVMEMRYPGSNRSFVHFTDGAVCGGDLNVVDQRLFLEETPIWRKLTNARKNPLKQAALLGIDNLMLVALRLVSLDTAARRICKKLSIKAQVLRNPFAETAMDADKPNQLAILRADLIGKS